MKNCLLILCLGVLTASGQALSLRDPVFFNQNSTPSSLLGNLIAYWNFDTYASGCADSSDFNKTVTTNAAGVSIGVGVLSNCLSNNASTGRAIAQRSTNSATGYSLSLWFNADATNSADAKMFLNGNTSSYGVQAVLINGTLYGQFVNASSQTVSFSPTNIVTNAWYHYVLTYNGSQATLWVNGNVITNRSFSGNLRASTDTNQYFFCYTANAFVGRMDEVGIWSRALTTNEVQTLYKNGSALTYPF